VRLVDVDVVGLQPAQRAVGGLQDVLAGQAEIVVTLRADRPEDLGHDLQRLPPLPLERLAEDGLRPGVGVDVGGVEGADAGVQGGAYAGLGPLVLHLRAVGQPVAIGDLGDLEAGLAEVAVFHDPFLSSGNQVQAEWAGRSGLDARIALGRPEVTPSV